MTKKKKTKIVPQTLKGFRDFLPKEATLREWMTSIFVKSFKKFGFEPLQSPTLEYAETLLGKLGQEEKLIQTFKDKGGRLVGFRYDQTVPTARILAQYPEITKPFKRYQIQLAFRFEKPQRGRYREFMQCDADIFGVKKVTAELEIMQLINDIVPKFGFKDFVVKINSRKLLNELALAAEITKDQLVPAMQSLDTLDKSTEKQVIDLMIKKGIKEKKAKRFMNSILAISKDSLTTKSAGQKELKKLFLLIEMAKLDPKKFTFAPSLARGLDYYTGLVWEVLVAKGRVGVIAGGGRFDNLIQRLGGLDIPATGISFGFEPIYELIKDKDLLGFKKQATQVLVTIFSPEYLEKSIEVATLIRRSIRVNTELYLDPEAKLDKQLKYADRKGIPYVIVIGPEEVEKNTVALKDMRTRKQKSILLTNLSELKKEMRLKNGGKTVEIQ